ncbi:MAG: CRISPR system precrRNA processing endoribonuclease RAMP protein Cas6 [Oscillospiraceae bacterium]
MLYRSDLYVCGEGPDGLKSEIAVKIHGAVMKNIPTEYAAKLHISGYHPYSVYAFPYGSGYIIRVSALNEEAKVITDVMSEVKKITLYGIPERLTVTDVFPGDPVSAEKAAGSINGRMIRTELVTPAMIKTGGRPCNLPDIPRYFYSVILKYNSFEKDELSYDDFLSAFNMSVLDRYSFESVKYNVSGNIFPGMSGYFDIILAGNKKQTELLKKVFAYASYCGIGGKTGMGMGGIRISSE